MSVLRSLIMGTVPRSSLRPIAALGVTFLLLILAGQTKAEDVDRYRPYLGFRYGEFDAGWGIHDLWEFSLGANFDQHWGVEFTSDLFETELFSASGALLSEVSVITLTPAVRFRYPLFADRLVPYVIAGAGPAFVQLNDRKSAGIGLAIDAESTRFAGVFGGGVEYFISDNLALGIEGKYVLADALNVSIGDEHRRLDISTALLTVGLRVYFDENSPRPFAAALDPAPLQPYLGVRLGVAVLLDERLSQGARLDNEASSFGGVNQSGGVALGLNLGSHWGLEIATDLNEFNLELPGLGAVGEYSVYSVVPQLALRMPTLGGRLVPYAMCGAGFVYAEYNDAKPAGFGLDLMARRFNPAVRLGAGVEYFVTSNFSLTSDLRWLYTWNHDVALDNTSIAHGDLSLLQFQVGFRVYFTRPRAR